jgi:mono/diheme cytochrome c family protein
MSYRFVLLGMSVLIGVSLLGRERGSELVGQAPASTAALVNPYEGSGQAAQAGAKLYSRHCAGCHGNDREGRNRVPALRTDEVARASPGALFWVLKNGALARGMPSWSKLPDQQRWQLVTYLKNTAPRRKHVVVAPVQATLDASCSQ